jgi:hypothetical protein
MGDGVKCGSGGSSRAMLVNIQIMRQSATANTRPPSSIMDHGIVHRLRCSLHSLSPSYILIHLNC